MKTAISVVGLFLSATAWAQAPGGVGAQLKMWLRADASSTIGLSSSTNLVERWQYFNDSDPVKAFRVSPPFLRNGGLNDGTRSFDPRPTLVSNGLNFQHTVRFFGDQKMDGPIDSNAPIGDGDDSYSVFIVWNSSNLSMDGERIWSQWDCDEYGGLQRTGASFVTGSDGATWVYGGQFEFWPYSQGIQRTFTPAEWYISNLNLLAQNANDLEITDQHNLNNPLVLSTDPDGELTGGGPPDGDGVRHMSTVSHNLGTCLDGRSRFQGDLAELIIYDRTLTSLERQKVFSYLAIKYGITLRNSYYVASNWNGLSGTIFWQPGLGFDHDIFGVARDDAAGGSGLLTTVSNSINTGSGDGSGQLGKGNMVIAVDPAGFQNLQSLMVGHNGASLSNISTDLPAPITTSRRLAREWRVVNNGNVSGITLSFDINGLSITGDPTDVNNFALIIDEDGNGDFTNGAYTMRIPNVISEGRLHFNNLTLPHNAVFTIVTTLQAGIPLQAVWLDFTVKKAAGYHQLHWNVLEDDRVSHYEVELALSSNSFLKIAEVNTTKMTSSQIRSYSYNHRPSNVGLHAYRVKLLYKDGSYAYSKVLRVQHDDDARLSIFPSPFKSSLAIQMNADSEQDVTVKLMELSGRVVYAKTFKAKKGINQVKLGALEKLAKGQYVILVTGDTFHFAKRVVK